MDIVSDNSKSNYGAINKFTYNRNILKFNLCDYNDADILVRGYITAVIAPVT